MKELQLPPSHNSRREWVKRARGEHCLEQEENTPTDAPDVENRHQADARPPIPTIIHPQGRDSEGPSRRPAAQPSLRREASGSGCA